MKSVVSQVKIETMLPRVKDLEHSAQWTSLAEDIEQLERFRRMNKSATSRADKRDTLERHSYQLTSVPEMQRASTVNFDNDCGKRTERSADYLETEGSRWSWKPKTDFEREYFYKDYKDYYCGDQTKCFDLTCSESPGQTCHNRDYYSRDRNYPRETRHLLESPARRSGRYSDGLNKEHFSDSRERLHEIFEHNRYLRRQFFASTAGNARQDCSGLPRNFGRSNQEAAAKRYVGFGSTETLTSQSNQSSVSSINDRKSRWGQSSRSPEEEEDMLVELARLNNVFSHGKHHVNSRGNRGIGNESQKDGKVLVNILPGSEIRRADVRSVPGKLDEASNERNDGEGLSGSAGEARFLNATSSKREAHDKSHQHRVVLPNDADRVSWHRDRNLPEYLFGESTKIDTARDGGNQSSGDCDRSGYCTATNRTDMENCSMLNQLERQNQSAQAENNPYTWPISENRQSDSASARVLRMNAPSDDRNQQNLCRSLPNLTILKWNLDAPLYVARAVNVPEILESPESSPYKFDPHIADLDVEQRRDQQSGQCERTEGRTRLIGRGQSADEESVFPKCSIPRQIKATRIPPPPLDLSMVNEECERMEASERKYLNDYSVDVAILRSHEDLVGDLLTAGEKQRSLSDVIGSSSTSKIEVSGLRASQPCKKDNERRSFGPLHKSCGDLSLTDELQSPQLVNNCKSSASDLQTVDPAVRIARHPIDLDASRHDRAASPLFDQTDPIGGVHGGSALPLVYGPIPYSQ